MTAKTPLQPLDYAALHLCLTGYFIDNAPEAKTRVATELCDLICARFGTATDEETRPEMTVEELRTAEDDLRNRLKVAEAAANDAMWIKGEYQVQLELVHKQVATLTKKLEAAEKEESRKIVRDVLGIAALEDRCDALEGLIQEVVTHRECKTNPPPPEGTLTRRRDIHKRMKAALSPAPGAPVKELEAENAALRERVKELEEQIGNMSQHYEALTPPRRPNDSAQTNQRPCDPRSDLRRGAYRRLGGIVGSHDVP